MNKKYNYFYKITNLINNHFYYGVHSTNNIDDGYMGSGHRLHRAYKKYGTHNFIKEIIKYFNNREEALDYEEYIVNEELVKNKECYNEVIGGGGIKTIGLFPVKNSITGEKMMMSKDDPRYISGEFHTLSYGLTPTVDKYNNHYFVDKNDKRLKTGELKKQFEGKVCVIDKNGNKFYVEKTDQLYINGELKPYNKGMTLYKDNDGNCKMLYNDDPLVISGKYIPFHKGRQHSNEHKRKISEARKKNSHIKEKQSGYNTKWMKNEKTGQRKMIKKENVEYFLSLGWKLGRV